MSAVFSPEVVQFAGAVIVCGVLIQVAVMLASSFRRLGYEREQRRHALEALRYQVEVVLAQSHEERERIEASWNGFRKFEILRKEREIEGAHSFYLIPHDGKPLPPFLPGQYLTFQLKIPNQPSPSFAVIRFPTAPATGTTTGFRSRRCPRRRTSRTRRRLELDLFQRRAAGRRYPRCQGARRPFLLGHYRPNASCPGRWRDRNHPGAEHAEHDLRVRIEARDMVLSGESATVMNT